MEHRKQLNQKQLNLIEKAISFLGGLFLGAFVLIMLLKIASSYWGVLLGLILNTGAAIAMLKKAAHKSQLVIIAYGIISSVIATVVLAAVLWIFLQIAFQGIAN